MPFDAVEREALVARSPSDTRLAPIVSARSARIGPKLCVVRWKTPSERIELIGEAAAGDGSGTLTSWLTSAVLNWLKLNWKSLVKCADVRLLAGQRRQAVDDQAARAEEVGEDRREIRHRRRQVVGILRARPACAMHTTHTHSDHESDRPTITAVTSAMSADYS